MSLPIGTAQRTTNGAVLTSGKKVRLYEVILRSTSGGGGVVTIYNNTSASGTAYDVVNGTTSLTVRVPYVGGMLLENGCYITVDGNVEFVTFICEQENG